jgi:hypothetical protein
VIVISGALVLVALILLIIGVVGPELSFVYASIGVSLVSLVFLVIGILQRRGEAPLAAEAAQDAPAATDADDSVTAVIPAQAGRAGSRRVTEQTPPAAASAEQEPVVSGGVLVVEGRPRYHVDGCRYLANKTPEQVDVAEAREEGFTPCGVCKPDDALAAHPSFAEQPVAQPTEEIVEEDVPGVEVPTPARRRTAAKAPAKKAPAKAPTKKVAAKKVAAQPPVKTTTRAVTRTAAPAPTPTRAATVAAPATAAGAVAGNRPGSVVVIPDRGKYHRAECRYVRGVDEAEVLSKTAAGRQGYAACGVCKP